VRKIGESREDPVDVRVVCASHQNLARLVAAGRFREDLFYRLNVLELRMPTLRERAEDVPVLAGVLLEQLAGRYGDPRPKRLTRPALQQLCAYPFPGNVRELENLLERAYAFAEGESIDVDDLGALGAEIERSPLFHRTREAHGGTRPILAILGMRDLAIPGIRSMRLRLAGLTRPIFLRQRRARWA
jgi:two-component system response regulator PilR (NtrC family)